MCQTGYFKLVCMTKIGLILINLTSTQLDSCVSDENAYSTQVLMLSPNSNIMVTHQEDIRKCQGLESIFNVLETNSAFDCPGSAFWV